MSVDGRHRYRPAKRDFNRGAEPALPPCAVIVHCEQPDSLYELRERWRFAVRAVAALPPRRRAAVLLRLGFGSTDATTWRAIGRAMGVSGTRAQHNGNRGFRELRIAASRWEKAK